MITFYAIVVKETREPVTEAFVKQFYPNYGSSPYYRKSHKIYPKLSSAKTALRLMPETYRELLAIQPYSPSGDLIEL